MPRTHVPLSSVRESLPIQGTTPPASNRRHASSPLPGNAASSQRQRYRYSGLGNNPEQFADDGTRAGAPIRSDQLQIAVTLHRLFQAMQHHLNASAIDIADLGTIQNNSRTMALEQGLQFLQEYTDSIQVQTFWHLHDDYGPTG